MSLFDIINKSADLILKLMVMDIIQYHPTFRKDMVVKTK